MASRVSITPSMLLAAAALLVAGCCLTALLAPIVQAKLTQELRAERGWNATPEATVRLRASQAERLSKYAWIDRPKGVVAVPIERAMQLCAQEMAQESKR